MNVIYDLGKLHMTECEDLRPRLIVSLAEAYAESPLPEGTVQGLLTLFDGQKRAAIYDIDPVGVFIGNGNHRLAALYLANVELPSGFYPDHPDMELEEVLQGNAQLFRRKYGFYTVSEFVQRRLPKLCSVPEALLAPLPERDREWERRVSLVEDLEHSLELEGDDKDSGYYDLEIDPEDW